MAESDVNSIPRFPPGASIMCCQRWACLLPCKPRAEASGHAQSRTQHPELNATSFACGQKTHRFFQRSWLQQPCGEQLDGRFAWLPSQPAVP